MKIRAFITHKLSEYYSDCQDRFGINPDTNSIALSDGMGSTWQQKIWAQLLVDRFVECDDWLPTHDSIKPLCALWREKVISQIQKLKETSTEQISEKKRRELDALIYRNERNLAMGRSAGATFVGIRFDRNKWVGSVLGDSCLVEWNGIKEIFYTSQSGESFDSYPDYFDSNALREGKGIPKPIEGILSNGTVLLLISDPFSDFLFEQRKQGDITSYIQQLLGITSHEEFESIVEKWRNAGMPNDDTTLIIVENDDADLFTLNNIDNLNLFIDQEKNEKEKEEADTKEIQLSNENKQEDEKRFASEGPSSSLTQVDEKSFIDEFKILRSSLEKKKKYLHFLKNKDYSVEALEILLKKYDVTMYK